MIVNHLSRILGEKRWSQTKLATLEVQRWVNEYRGILGRRSAGRVLLEVAEKAGVKGIELLL